MGSPIIGAKVVKVRLATKKEKATLGVDDTEYTRVVVLDNGNVLFALRDAEGNGAGHMTVVTKDGKAYDA